MAQQCVVALCGSLVADDDQSYMRHRMYGDMVKDYKGKMMRKEREMEIEE